MTLHHAPPMCLGVHRRRGRGFAANSRRIEQNLRTLQRHDARTFRKPLIPAYSRAEFTVAGLPNLESRIAGTEIELLLVSGAIRNVGFAIAPEHTPVGVDHGERIVIGVMG